MKTFEQEFLTKDFFQNPFPTYQKLREWEWIIYIDDIKSWVVVRYDDVLSGLNDPRLSADRWNSYFWLLSSEDQKNFAPLKEFFSKWLLFSDWEYHQQLRGKLVKSSFFKSLEKDRTILAKIAWDNMDTLLGIGREIDFFRDYSLPLSIKVISRILWLQEEEFQKVMEWTNKMIHFIWSWKPSTEQGELALWAYYEFVDYVHTKIGNAKDLIYWTNLFSDLLKLTKDWEISMEELIATLWNILIDWYEPSALGISHGIYLLGTDNLNKDAAVQDPIAFQKNGIQEIFRLEPPFMCAARRSLVDFQFNNIQLKTNDRVVFVLGSANRDSSVYSDPNKLDLHRPNASKQLTFWSWSHKCIWFGLSYSTMNIWLNAFLEKTQWTNITFQTPIYRESMGVRWFNHLIWELK